jgi:anhydro-N-acetylmuramic acid kinase
MSELFIGIMSGTSINAIDAVIVDFSQPPLKLIASHTKEFPQELQSELNDLCSPGTNEIYRLGMADAALGKIFAETVNELLASAKIDAKEIHAIGSHGQTIRHHPHGPHPFTLQIGDPNIIAEETKIKTVADFRRRDIACGGQGAPLAPAFHQYLFRTPHKNRIILNLGGIANITFLPADSHSPITGFGAWSSKGKMNQTLLKKFLEDDYFKLQPPKSTGREYFNLAWLEKYLSFLKLNLSPEDIQTTLCELTAITIANAITSTQSEIFICGGGIKNLFLLERLRKQLIPHELHSTEKLGAPPEWIEAMAFAWLARQTLSGKAGNLSEVTGAKRNRILGAIYS